MSDYNFIGRECEIRQLEMNFEEGINTILISPRRWGKTSLVKRVCQEVDKEKVITAHPIYIGGKLFDSIENLYLCNSMSIFFPFF